MRPRDEPLVGIDELRPTAGPYPPPAEHPGRPHELGTDTDRLFNPDYPVWLGADKRLSEKPLPLSGKVQVSGHIKVERPDVSAVRIRIDTSGGICEPLTACILSGPTAAPEFVFSN